MTAGEVQRARAAHEERADRLNAPHRERKARGEKHPIEDFLHTYYPFSPGQLRRWHPGWQVGYEVSADAPLRDQGDVDSDGCRRWYRDVKDASSGTTGEVRTADLERFVRERGDAAMWIHRLLTNSSFAEKPGNFSCFGLHEWAMVYRLRPGEKRHESLPLRLGAEATNRVVEANRLVCSHIDAFRFFTPEAVPLNASHPTRERQPMRDDPACLHVGMDLYKWSMKLAPLLPSDIALDCFEHALDLRILDMEASPYDCRGYGYGVVPIETEEGKAEYVRRQRALAERSDALRLRILAVLDPLAPLFA
ncbi:3-methyladenine DNA glycosylase [Dermabacter sp. p3-SID358]|uniref:3-methyladenine DNA glycosylase n=1 Tax=Dermabacter sp. p3-SID358 TaxID=2916114 RepID=UPI0021A39FAD|nr:3-methyladenine DNA glycosylase [Dermabacter sp. p3-SID358]